MHIAAPDPLQPPARRPRRWRVGLGLSLAVLLLHASLLDRLAPGNDRGAGVAPPANVQTAMQVRTLVAPPRGTRAASTTARRGLRRWRSAAAAAAMSQVLAIAGLIGCLVTGIMIAVCGNGASGSMVELNRGKGRLRRSTSLNSVRSFSMPP